MEEDSDEKIRRNLIVASAVFSLCAWLNLPALTIVKRVLGEDASTAVEPWRLWFAVLVVLAYLSLRYHFSDGARLSWDVAKNELQSFRINAMNALLFKQTKCFTKKGVESSAFHQTLASYVRSRAGDRATRPEITVTNVIHERLGKGNARLALSWPVENISDSTDRPVGFELSKWEIFKADAQAFFRLIAYSHTSTAFFVPVLLAAFAIGMSLWQLVKEFIH